MEAADLLFFRLVVTATQWKMPQVEVGIGVDGNFEMVESFKFLIFRDTHANDLIEYLEEDIRNNEDIDDIGHGADALGNELPGITVKEAGNRPFDAVEAVTVFAVGKETKGQYAPGAVGAVNRDGTDRIVNLHDPFNEENAESTEDAADTADEVLQQEP